MHAFMLPNILGKYMRRQNNILLTGIPTSRLALYVNGNNELQDYRHICEYELTYGSEIDVSIRPSPGPVASGMTNTPSMTGSKKLRVAVIPKSGPKKVFIDVNPTDKVQVNWKKCP